MDNFEQFDKEVRQFAKDVPDKHLVPLHKKLHFEALNGIIYRTPVDTGRARGNWQTTIGSPAEDEVDGVDTDGAATVERGMSALAGLGPFTVSYIANNLAYILPLEEGHSSQHPAGMVAVTVEEMKAMFP